jgi:hypothetical protein
MKTAWLMGSGLAYGTGREKAANKIAFAADRGRLDLSHVKTA